MSESVRNALTGLIKARMSFSPVRINSAKINLKKALNNHVSRTVNTNSALKMKGYVYSNKNRQSITNNFKSFIGRRGGANVNDVLGTTGYTFTRTKNGKTLITKKSKARKLLSPW